MEGARFYKSTTLPHLAVGVGPKDGGCLAQRLIVMAALYVGGLSNPTNGTDPIDTIVWHTGVISIYETVVWLNIYRRLLHPLDIIRCCVI